MVSARQTLLWVGLVVGSFTLGCGGGDPSPSDPGSGSTTSGTPQAGTTAGSGTTGLTGSSGSSGTTGTIGSPGIGYIRVANLSPDLPPIDLCFGAPNGNTFIGPVVHEATKTKDLVAFGTVTNYIAVPAGSYEVRVVAGGGLSCADTAGNVRFKGSASVKAGQYATLAAVGLTSGTPLVSLQHYTDDISTLLGKTALRFIHAAPAFPSVLNSAVDVGLGTRTTVAPVFNNVRFAKIALPDSIIDGNGYANVNPISDATVTLRPAGSTADTLSIGALRLNPNEANTAFFILQPPVGPSMLFCMDVKELASPTMQKASCQLRR